MFALAESPLLRDRPSRICRGSPRESSREAMRVRGMEQQCFLRSKKKKTLVALTGASSVGVGRCNRECYLLLMGLGECKPVAGVSMVRGTNGGLWLNCTTAGIYGANLAF
jgi:hypothetical protein